MRTRPVWAGNTANKYQNRVVSARDSTMRDTALARFGYGVTAAAAPRPYPRRTT